MEPFRTYIDILEYYNQPTEPQQVLVESDIIAVDQSEDLIEKLQDAVFKMRSYADTTGGDYSLGFESGLEMAAGMIENILNNLGDRNGS